MSYCILKPESKLYDDIFDRLGNRENSLFLYEYFKTKSFISEHKNDLEFENDEPTFKSIEQFIDIEKAASPEAKIKAFQTELNQNNSLLPITEVAEKVVEFNNSHPSYIAEIVSVNKQGNDVVVKATDSTSVDKKLALENAVKTYKTINKFLADLNIPITILDANIMRYEDGLIRPDRLYNTVDDIFGVLNIANNKSGLNSIPEEFAHFILENIKSDTIIQRTLNQIDEETTKYILGDEYEQIKNYYEAKNRPDLIQREVLGRMYAKLLKGEEITKPLPYRNLLQRGLDKLIAFIYKTFGISSSAAFQSKLNSIVTTLKPLTNFNNLKNIITPETLREFKQSGDVLAHTKENVNLLKDATSAAMSNLAQHIAIYRDKETSSTFDDKEIEIYKNIKQAYYSGKYFQGLVDYAYESSTLMNTIYTQMASIIKDIGGDKEPTRITLLENAHKLKEIKNYIDSYEEPITFIFTLLNELNSGNFKLPADIYISPEDIALLSREANNIYSLLGRLKGSYKTLGKKTLYHFYKEFFSNDNTGTRLDRKGNSLDLMTVLEETDSDISLLDRWLQAASASSDNFVGLIDRAIQDKQQTIRQIAQETEHKIIQIDQKFKLDGGKSTSFIYEKDENNIPTAYISNPLFSKAKFNKAEQLFKATSAYQTASESGQESKYKEWYYANTVDYDYEIEYTNSKGEKSKRYRSYRIPSPTLYPSDAKFSPAEQEYYNQYVELKRQLDFLLPPTKSHPFIAVQKLVENAAEIIQNNQVSRIDQIKNLAENTSSLVKVVENDEMSYQGTKDQNFKFTLNWRKNKSDVPTRVLTNFDKSIHYQIPIYYTSIIENKRMLSQDASSALIDYAIMAHNYSGMHEIVDFMEITKDISALRRVGRMDGDRPAKSVYTVDNVEFSNEAEINSKGSEVNKRIESLINTQVYGQTRLKGGTVLGMDTNKALDTLIKYTSWSMLGFNFFTGVNNVLVGKMQMFIESKSWQFFDTKEWLAADTEYMRNIGAVLAELNKPITTSKLGLLSEMFNVGLHWKETSKGRNFYKNSIENVLQHAGASFLMTAGEHHMQLSTAIAMLKHMKVKDSQGKEISFYDALEVTTTKHKGTVIDGKMIIKQGVTNLDGSEITKKQIRDIGLQIGKVNQKLHGIYNQEDMMEIKRTAVGRLAMMYRNFIMPTFNKRIRGLFGGKVPYDYYFNDYFEGYYTTTFHFLRDIVGKKAYKNLTVLKTLWKSLSPVEQANLRRSYREVLGLALINIAIFALLQLGGDGDEPDEVWLNRMMYYMLKRNNLEALTYITPWSTFETILVSPTAILSPMQKMGAVIGSLFSYPFGYGSDVLESGRYKGETKLYRDVMQALPIYNSVYDFFHIHEEDKRFKIFE